MKKTKVLFVCLGNICRSPLAEAIFKHKIKAKGLEERFEADSCGTSNYHIGGIPDERTIRNAMKNGISIEHFARQLCVDDLEQYDYILAMDQNNYNDILKLNAFDHEHKVVLMRSFDPVGIGEVPDPYFGGEKGFQEVFEILDRTMENFIDHLLKKSSK